MKITFNYDLYNPRAIEEAIVAYKEIASFTVTHSTNTVECELIYSKYDEAITIKEFGNYVLDLSIKKGNLDNGYT